MQKQPETIKMKRTEKFATSVAKDRQGSKYMGAQSLNFRTLDQQLYFQTQPTVVGMVPD